MVQEITKRVQLNPHLKQCKIYIASSHTHSGGGAYLCLPLIGEVLTGIFNSEVTEFYIEKTMEAIVSASQHLIPAKISIGYHHVSIFGLANDAHGYIILPESWIHKTNESALSFGGQNYGEIVSLKAKALLESKAPISNHQ